MNQDEGSYRLSHIWDKMLTSETVVRIAICVFGC